MPPPPAAVMLPPPAQLLAKYRGKAVFFEALHGNNGDKLIEMGAREFLHHLGVHLVSSPAQAEILIFNGGAGMTDIWVHALETVRKVSQKYPDKPLVVLPSSFSFKRVDFASFFHNRTAPLYLYAREVPSLQIVQNLAFKNDVHFGLDHDMAFHLKPTPFIRDLIARKAAKYVLIVERRDAESFTGIFTPPKPTLKGRLLPGPVKQFVRNRMRPINYWRSRKQFTPERMMADANTPFAQEALAQVYAAMPQLKGLPVYSADISQPQVTTFDGFCTMIAEAAAVVSTRLHVGILSALIEQPTWVKSGNFHKIRGIYEQSMTDMPHVRLF